MDPEYEKRLLCVQNGQHISTEPTYKSPVKEAYGDRFIPVRSKAIWNINFDHVYNDTRPGVGHQQGTSTPRGSTGGGESGKDGLAYACLLKNELLGAGIEDIKEQQQQLHQYNIECGGTTPSSSSTPRSALMPRETRNLFHYRLTGSTPGGNDTSPYSLSPVSCKSQRLLRSPRKAVRKIPRVPFKVLDAPELQDDFYLNLVDWSSQNILSVGLGSCVYLWSACTSQVTRLCDLSAETDSVTSVSWSERGNYIAVGTHKGTTQIWDVTASKKITTLAAHHARVGALAWNGDLLASGSRDRMILLRDTRCPSVTPDKKFIGHKQEVCGLKWSPDRQHLASGGNDNRLYVWSVRGGEQPMQTYSEHLAAVKAIAWSPHQHGLLASGGGTADRRIRFWNTLTGRPLQCVDTGSQVCNLSWSKHSSELVSTHGYSQNQILVWKYPSLVQIAKLTGHTFRVLYLAMSPDGESIVTGAGDETLRFWNVFSKTRSTKETKSELNLFTRIR